jgi:hypothetical protein
MPTITDGRATAPMSTDQRELRSMPPMPTTPLRISRRHAPSLLPILQALSVPFMKHRQQDLREMRPDPLSGNPSGSGRSDCTVPVHSLPRQCGCAVDRGTRFPGITPVSMPVLSPAWEVLLVLPAAGQAHDCDGDAVGPLSRAMQSAAARLSESVRLLRLG